MIEILEENPDEIKEVARIASKKRIGEVMSKNPVTIITRADLLKAF